MLPVRECPASCCLCARKWAAGRRPEAPRLQETPHVRYILLHTKCSHSFAPHLHSPGNGGRFRSSLRYRGSYTPVSMLHSSEVADFQRGIIATVSMSSFADLTANTGRLPRGGVSQVQSRPSLLIARGSSLSKSPIAFSQGRYGNGPVGWRAARVSSPGRARSHANSAPRTPGCRRGSTA